MTRILLLIATNFAVLIVASIIMAALGINSQSMMGLLIMASLFGFGGSFVSLLISKWIAKKSMGCTVITNPRDESEQWLVNTVADLANRSGIKMPEVAIYQSDDVNAFATGPSKDNSLVAVSTGLLYKMSSDEVEAVLAHEVSHVANGDMVTMTLLQGVLNTFVIFASRVCASIINNAMRSDDGEGEGLGGIAYFGLVFVLDLIFGIFASLILNAFSRRREYRADSGAAKLSGKDKMIAALERLKSGPENEALPSQMAALGINTSKKTLSELWMTHPTLDKRIAALRNSQDF